MFCTNCGKENTPNMNFCTSCGAPIQNTAREQAVFQTPTAEMPQGNYTAPSPYAVASPAARAKKTRTFAVLAAVITIIGLLLSGPALKIDMSDLEDSYFVDDVKLADINIPIPILSYAQGAGQLGNRLNKLTRALKKEARDSDFAEEMLEEMEDQVAPIKTGIAAMSFIRIITDLALVLLVLFLYFTLEGKKNAALFGQIGNILALVSSVGVIILSILANSTLKDLDIGDPVSIGPAFWTFAVLLISIFGISFITMRKDILNK